MFQNILCCVNNRSRDGVSILQRNIGSFRGFKFMASGDIFTGGNVHSAKKGESLEPKMGASANFQWGFNGDFNTGFNWIGLGTNRSEDKIIHTQNSYLMVTNVNKHGLFYIPHAIRKIDIFY